MLDAKLIGQRLLLAFPAKEDVSSEALEILRTIRPAGITLFRHLNIDNPGQLRKLTSRLQDISRELGIAPFIIAADQEGGQLMALGDGATPLPGNMAIGATGSSELARKAGYVLGREMAAVGVNIDYAPVCDVSINPQNPVIGIRSFGENPLEVARLAGEMIEGIQSAGVGACAKHFPGHGDTSGDSHHGLPTVDQDLERLEKVEFPPFRAAVKAGVKMVMTAHVALPAIDGMDAPPATLSRNILHGLLREKLGYQGVIVTDAMDMKAIQQGNALGESAVRAVSAGADLLLLTADPSDQRRVYESLRVAINTTSINENEFAESVHRISELRSWIAQQEQPDLDVVGCEAHHRVADEIAEQSITLVRDRDHLLPLQLTNGQKIAVVIPRPVNLTPADTSAFVHPLLADEIRKIHPDTDEFIIPHVPSTKETTSLLSKLSGYNLIVVGTINAFNNPPQADLVKAVLGLEIPTVVVSLRLPYDLIRFPEVSTHICTYGILEPSMRALAKALFGKIPFMGRLPVSIPGLYPVGHRLR